MNLQKCINEFEYYIQVEKNYSKKTLRTYKNGLINFLNYLKENRKSESINLTDVSIDDVKNYIFYLKDEANNKPKTINLKISTLKSFYKFLLEKKYITSSANIMNDIHLQKLPKILPVYLAYDEAESFLLGIKLLSNNSTRDYALFSTFLLTGARLSELAQLELDQINFREKTITFYGKGAKERTVPLIERAEQALRDYIDNGRVYLKQTKKNGKSSIIEDRTLRGRVPSIKTEHVFLNKYGKPLSERGIQLLFKSLAQKTGIYKRGLSVHKLRHTCMTLLYGAGVDILKIKTIAGHENINTTQIYTHINSNDLRKSMQVNPLNNINYDNVLIQRIKWSYEKNKKLENFEQK